MNGRVLAMVLVVLAACARVPAESAVPADALIPSLDVTVEGDSVLMTLHLTSALAEPVVLEFPSAQRADFSVRGEDGEVVWT